MVDVASLSNGLQVVTHTDPTWSMAAVNVWYKVGSRHERPGQHGFAHLLEHLMFQGSDGLEPRRHVATLQAHGGARINATTNQDRTNYFQTVPDRLVPLAMRLEAERMANLAPALTADNVDAQRRTVEAERRQVTQVMPYGRLPEVLLGSMFPPGHPYAHPAIGSVEQLGRAHPADLAAFHRRHYRPNNAVLSVVGNVAQAEVLHAAERYFGHIAAGTSQPSPPTCLPHDLGGPLHRTVVDDIPAERLYLAFRTPPFGSPEHDSVVVLAAVLGLGRGSALYREVVTERALATAAGPLAEAWTYCSGSSLLVCKITARPGVSFDAVERATLDVVVRVGDGMAGEDLDRARTMASCAWLRGLATLEGRADAFAEHTALYGDPGSALHYAGRLRSVTDDRVAASAERVLSAENRVSIRFVRPDGR